MGALDLTLGTVGSTCVCAQKQIGINRSCKPAWGHQLPTTGSQPLPGSPVRATVSQHSSSMVSGKVPCDSLRLSSMDQAHPEEQWSDLPGTGNLKQQHETHPGGSKQQAEKQLGCPGSFLFSSHQGWPTFSQHHPEASLTCPRHPPLWLSLSGEQVLGGTSPRPGLGSLGFLCMLFNQESQA